jgi:hypothetical protein
MMAKKTKTKSTGKLNGAKGGSGHMFGKMGVQPSQPGVSAPSGPPKHSKDMLKGGGTGYQGKQGGTLNVEAGKVSMPKQGKGKSKGFSISGGKGHMFGKGSSQNARAK